MSETVAWELPERSPGRMYFYPRDLEHKYEHMEPVIERIHANIAQCVKLESAVRLTLDSPTTHPTTSVLALPFVGEGDMIHSNIAHMVFEMLWGYYLTANPKTTHHGLTHLIFDGNETNLLYREIEKVVEMLGTRADIACKVLKNYQMAVETPAFNRDVYMQPTFEKVLNIHVGVRVFTYGEGVHNVNVFLPVEGNPDAIKWIYYNLEHIIHNNLVAYDELHDRSLPVSESLLHRELESLLVRARQKGNTRKKILNGLNLHTVMMDDPTMMHHISLADQLYDKINRIDLLDEAAVRSQDLYNTALIRSAEITTAAGVSVDSLAMEERVYIDRSTVVGEEAPQVVTVPAAQAEEVIEEVAAEPVAVPASDGLDEL